MTSLDWITPLLLIFTYLCGIATGCVITGLYVLHALDNQAQKMIKDMEDDISYLMGGEDWKKEKGKNKTDDWKKPTDDDYKKLLGE
jgi:hypothetical protein